MSAPTRMASSAWPRPMAGTRKEPVTSKRRLNPRFPHRTALSNVPRVRDSLGTGSMPHSGPAVRFGQRSARAMSRSYTSPVRKPAVTLARMLTIFSSSRASASLSASEVTYLAAMLLAEGHVEALVGQDGLEVPLGHRVDEVQVGGVDEAGPGIDHVDVGQALGQAVGLPVFVPEVEVLGRWAPPSRGGRGSGAPPAARPPAPSCAASRSWCGGPRPRSGGRSPPSPPAPAWT